MKRILKLLQDIDRNGYDGIGKPEPLGENLSGYWIGGLMNAIVLSTELMMGLSKSFSVGHTIVINNKTGASVIGRLGFFVNY